MGDAGGIARWWYGYLSDNGKASKKQESNSRTMSRSGQRPRTLWQADASLGLHSHVSVGAGSCRRGAMPWPTFESWGMGMGLWAVGGCERLRY
jgi:hypothetical protein